MKKIGRKIFFGSLGTSALGFLFLKNGGFRLSNILSPKKKIQISENPLAVKRDSKGKKNG